MTIGFGVEKDSEVAFALKGKEGVPQLAVKGVLKTAPDYFSIGQQHSSQSSWLSKLSSQIFRASSP